MQTFWDMWELRIATWAYDDPQPALNRLGLVKVERLNVKCVYLIFKEGAKEDIPVFYHVRSTVVLFCLDGRS